jgi:hypothetical protein
MGKKQLKIARAPEYIKQNPEDWRAAVDTTQFLLNALDELFSSSTSSRSSATAHAGLILQAIAWLCRAHSLAVDKDVDKEVLACLHNVCMQALKAIGPLESRALTLQQLRPLLLPCPEDGATPGGFFVVHYLQIAACALHAQRATSMQCCAAQAVHAVHSEGEGHSSYSSTPCKKACRDSCKRSATQS